MRSLATYLCLFLSGLNWLSPVLAQPTIQPPIPLPAAPNAKAIEASSIYLITVGLGKSLHSRYGHTFVEIHLGGITRIYNWGMFSFDDPMFPLKFYLGDRQYWVGSTDLKTLTYLYEKIEDREVWRQKVHLTQRQKSQFFHEVRKATAPENMFFGYEHFSANCATIPRDILDRVLGGALKQRLSALPSELQYRDYVRDHMAFIPPLGMLLDVVMNSKLDGPLSQWEESFFPVKLSEYLSQTPNITDELSLGTGQLLGPKQPLVKATSAHLSKVGWFPSGFRFVMMLALIIMLMGLRKPTRPIRVLSGAISLFWGFISGLIGLIMVVSWIFSSHHDMHHNINLLLFYPVDFIFMFWGVKKKAPPKLWLNSLVWLHLASMALLGILAGAGITHQNVSTAVSYLLPVQLGFLIWLLAKSQPPSPR